MKRYRVIIRGVASHDYMTPNAIEKAVITVHAEDAESAFAMAREMAIKLADIWSGLYLDEVAELP